MAENNEIPENADKILFAQDLMNQVMMDTAGITYEAMTAERYRDFIYSAFNETIMGAITFVYCKVANENKKIFKNMLDEDSVNLATFTTYARDLSQKCCTDSFDAFGFLHYCMRLTGVAMHFYNEGVMEAPDLAVTYIVNVLNNFDMKTDGWVTLNTVAAKFANLKYDTVKKLPPESISDEETTSSSGEQNLDTSSASIEKVLLEQHSSSSSSTESEEDPNELEKWFRTLSA